MKHAVGLGALLLGAGCLGASFTTDGAGGGASSSSGTAATTGSATTTTSSGSGPCPAMETICAGECVDTTTDVDNCGTCAHRCEIGEACADGVCTCAGNLMCPAKSPTVCTQTTGAGDPENCGTCGKECQDTQVCTDGACVCRFPLVACNGTCVDTESDPANCGGCGTACLPTEVCISPAIGTVGHCALAATAEMPCPANYTNCGGGSCVLTAAMMGDPAHCGDCATVCAPDEVCTLTGVCVKYYASPSCLTCPCDACGLTHRCCTMAGVPLCVAGAECGF